MLPPERVLMETYTVSRPTMRGALRILESDGLVNVERGVRGGARIVAGDLGALARLSGLRLQLDGTELNELIEAQTIMQLGAIASACAARDADDLTRLRAAVEVCAEAVTIEALIAAADGFGQAILRASHNRVLALYADITSELLQRQLGEHAVRSAITPDRAERAIAASVGQYSRLVDLIEDRDAERAETLWRSYLRRVGVAPAPAPSLFQMYPPPNHHSSGRTSESSDRSNEPGGS